MRSRVSSSRYSIAGYPSLYLGTSLELCCDEVGLDPFSSFGLAAKYKFERDISNNHTEISVIELSVKPQDFLDNQYDSNKPRQFKRHFRLVNNGVNLRNVESTYLIWYPLIASASYIRTNKSHPFAAEYIIPQLLMQWIRNSMSVAIDNNANVNDKLIGIRYFSCASNIASEKGFNYVFPTSGQKSENDSRFCPILVKAFRMTKPVYINEYSSVQECEDALIRSSDLKYVI